ncbi:MAG: hypothetical protein AB1696_23800, partial [Planctomycetota bacterium]
GYYGGLQFTMSTWRANGGTGSPHGASRGGRGGEAGPAGKPGEDTLGDGRNIATVMTMLDRAAGIVEAADVGDDFLAKVGMSQGEFRNFVAEFREAAKQRRSAPPASADGTRMAARDAASIDMLPGKDATIQMNKGRPIGGQEKPDDLRELFVDRRETVSPEYRDMVDEYFRVISAGRSVTPNPLSKE